MLNYPNYFFRLVRPTTVANRLKDVLNDPSTVEAVGVEDPRMLVEYVRDNHPDPVLQEAARKIFPYPDDPVTAGFDFGRRDTTQRPCVAIPFPDGTFEIYIASAPPVPLDEDSGAVTWVNCYRGMVADWCAEQRRARLAVNNAS